MKVYTHAYCAYPVAIIDDSLYIDGERIPFKEITTWINFRKAVLPEELVNWVWENIKLGDKSKPGDVEEYLNSTTHWTERLIVAQSGYLHEKLYKDARVQIRREVADHGNFLEVLVNDPEWHVRWGVLFQAPHLAEHYLKDEERAVRELAERYIS